MNHDDGTTALYLQYIYAVEITYIDWNGQRSRQKTLLVFGWVGCRMEEVGMIRMRVGWVVFHLLYTQDTTDKTNKDRRELRWSVVLCTRRERVNSIGYISTI
jgi:hypothetical protein